MRHGLNTGDIAPEFSLIGADGMIHTLVDYKGFKGTCFVFFTLDGKDRENTLNELDRLKEHYKHKSIAFVGVCIKQEEGFRETLKTLKSFNLDIDLLVDATGAFSSQFNVNIAPHAFIFNQRNHLIYSGCIIDAQTEQNYISEALDQLIGGLPIKNPWTEPVGSEVIELTFA
jgi:peroxiredoxin